MKTLDCRDRMCPHPVVETRKLLLAEPGVPFNVLVGDETARENVSRLASGQGYRVDVTPMEGGYCLALTPRETASSSAGITEAVRGKTVVFITGDTLGSGSEELGRILLKNFIFTMAEAGTAPDAMLFVNAGVKLAAEGSEVLEALDRLACMGTDIASCGLCLDFFHIKERLAVGRATNMLDILEHLQKAGRIIRP